MDELRLPWVPNVIALGFDLSYFHLTSFSSSFYLWHSKLGYVSTPHLKYLISKGSLGNLQTHDIPNCSGCKLVKFFALQFNQNVSLSIVSFDLIHFVVWGPSPIPHKNGVQILCVLYWWSYSILLSLSNEALV